MPVSGKQMTPMQFWISLSPMAPLFGVEWRFARMFPAAAWFNPVDTLGKMAAASAAETRKATEEAALKTVAAQKEAAAVMTAAAAKVVQAAAVPVTAAPAESAVAETVESVPTAVEDSSPAAEAIPTAPPAVLFDVAPLDADDLKQLKGVGPKLEEMLNAMGIYRFEQIAGFSDANIAWVDQNLTAFKGRPFRDDWVAQAKALL